MQSETQSRSAKTSLTALEISEILQARLIGDAAVSINGVDVVDRASSSQLAFISDLKNLPRVRKSQAAVIIVPEAVESLLTEYPEKSFLLVEDPEQALLLIAGLFCEFRGRPRIGVSPQAVVHPSAQIHGNSNIHPLAVVGRDVVIGNNCEIHSGVVIGDGCRIADHVTIYPNTVLYHDVVIGNNVIIHAACVIGADGFGYRLVNGGHERLPHYGTVRICDDVEIGAGTTIDRAKIGETVIGTGTRIDNQVMIGHNCQIGKHNLVVSQVGFAGSVTTGDYVVCAGQAGIADHVHLGTGAIIGAKAGVHRDMPGGQAYLGAPAAPAAETSRQLMALRRLPELRSTVKQLEKELLGLREAVALISTVSESAKLYSDVEKQNRAA